MLNATTAKLNINKLSGGGGAGNFCGGNNTLVSGASTDNYIDMDNDNEIVLYDAIKCYLTTDDFWFV